MNFSANLLGTFVSFSAGLVAVAVWQRLNLFSRPVLTFFAGFAALMGGLYAWLSALPPERMSQMIGLLASGLIADVVGLVGAILIGYAFYH